MHWDWVHGVASGFSKPEFYSLNHTIPKQNHLGLNFGSLSGEGEDFLFLNGEILPIKDIRYSVHREIRKGSNITISS